MSHITTYTGKRFDPTNPDSALIDITDIAHALSYTCRGNGTGMSKASIRSRSIAWRARRKRNFAGIPSAHSLRAYCTMRPRRTSTTSRAP